MRRVTFTNVSETVRSLRATSPPAENLERTVAGIVGDVRRRGDAALRYHTERLDGVALPTEMAVPEAAMREALAGLAPELRAALETAAANIRAYHEREASHPWRETLAQGQVVGQEIIPLDVAGLYVPGGLANYPSSVLMTAIPAQVAGVRRLVVCSPPRAGGGVASGVAAACALLGITELFPLGGAQAVAAMAYGTESVPRCDVIVGPGNAFVTEAKRQVLGEVAIDSLAGPSEVLIVSDEHGDAAWLAADLLAQAEHGSGAMGALLDVGGALGDEVAQRVEALTAELGVKTERTAIVAVPDVDTAVALVNEFAPEHLELHLRDAEAVLPRVRHAGAIFLGPYTATAFADYAAGTNHVLPTGGRARFAQGLSVAAFQKRVGVVAMDRAAALALGGPVATLALAEGLPAHARSVELRVGNGQT